MLQNEKIGEHMGRDPPALVACSSMQHFWEGGSRGMALWHFRASVGKVLRCSSQHLHGPAALETAQAVRSTEKTHDRKCRPMPRKNYIIKLKQLRGKTIFCETHNAGFLLLFSER